MKIMKCHVGLLLALLIMVTMFAGCGGNANADGKNKKGQTSGSQLNQNSQTSQNNQSNKNNQTSQNNQTTKADPNGFSSKEALVDVLVRMQFGKSVTKAEFKKIYPQEIWDHPGDYFDVDGATLDSSYTALKKRLDAKSENHASKYGADYSVTYSIIRTEVIDDMSSYTQEDVDYANKIWGVHPKDMKSYRVTVNVTIQGSERSETFPNCEFTAIKAGNKWYTT